jgi:hypothetical protein
MTRKEIEQKIRDFLDYHRDIDQDPRLEPVWVEFQPLLQAFCDECVKKEREACAQIAETEPTPWEEEPPDAQCRIAEKIRKRGEP